MKTLRTIAALGAATLVAANTHGAAGTVKFVAPADAAAIELVRQATSGMSKVTITTAQSFQIMEGARQVATFVSGESNSADMKNPGCFVAIVQNGRATIVPTIGSGSWQTEACGGVSGVGILSTGSPVLIGIVYEAFSPNATVAEPVIARWDRSAGTLAIDEAQSKRASTAGLTSVVALRRSVKGL